MIKKSELVSWQPCTPDNLPQLGERVLITDGYCVFESYRGIRSAEPKGWVWFRYMNCISCINNCVTHWMPLPKAPKKFFNEGE